jgi:kinetochore-associated protein 1
MYNKYKNSNGCVVDREARLKLYYYSELCKQYPNLRAPTNLDSIGISEFLQDLEKRQLNIELLKKLCKDFGWHYQKKLVQQIKIILSNQKLDIDIKTDRFGKDEVIVKSSVETIKKLCMPYLSEITEMEHLGAELEKFFIEEINVYFYELYLATIDLIEHAKELSPYYRFYRSILLLLKINLTFKRRSVEQEEHDHWTKYFASENGVLPVISNYRLPFTLLIKSGPENIIGKDLNVESFEIYYPLVKMHAELSAKESSHINIRVEACTLFAAKNSVQDLQSQAEATSNNYNLKPRNNALLQAALRMVNFLENKFKVMATLYFIMINTPRGCDQMEAAHECYKFAIANEDELKGNQKYAELMEKSKAKYPFLKTQHLLYLYGVYDDKLMQLVESPTSLINSLYHHESILAAQKKEINKLCGELADLHNIELLSIQNKLLRNWLAFADTSISHENQCGDETVYEDFMGNGAAAADEGDTHVSDENVIRAYYILNSWNNDAALDFLASELNSSAASAENQMQLYECFAKLMNESSMSYMEMVDADNYLLTRVCHYLKCLGISIKPEKFQSEDKVELLKKIWTSHYNNTKGLEVMALICLSYNVHIPQIWNGVLKQMVVHKMVSFKYLNVYIII